MDSTCNLRISLTFCGFHLQLRIPQQLNLTIQIFFIICLRIPYTVLDSANTVADSANSPIFWAILSGTMIYVIVCGIQSSIEDQRKQAILRTPRQIWFWPVADSTYNTENPQFGLVMSKTLSSPRAGAVILFYRTTNCWNDRR